MVVTLQLPLPVPDQAKVLEVLRSRYPSFSFGGEVDLLDQGTGLWRLTVTPDPSPAQIEAVQSRIDSGTWLPAAEQRALDRQAKAQALLTEIDDASNLAQLKPLLKKIVRHLAAGEDI